MNETIAKLEKEIEYLSFKVARLQAYEEIFDSMVHQLAEVKKEIPITVTCKYRELTGHPRKRNNGKQCPPGCQILLTKANRVWGAGCQASYGMKTARGKQND